MLGRYEWGHGHRFLQIRVERRADTAVGDEQHALRDPHARRRLDLREAEERVPERAERGLLAPGPRPHRRDLETVEARDRGSGGREQVFEIRRLVAAYASLIVEAIRGDGEMRGGVPPR